MISNWTFDVSGREAAIHATVKNADTRASILWIVRNRRGGLVDSGATTRSSPEEALIFLRALAAAVGIEGADTVELRAVDPNRTARYIDRD